MSGLLVWIFLKAQEFFDVLIEIKKEYTYLNYVYEEVAFKTRIDNSYIKVRAVKYIQRLFTMESLILAQDER